MVLEQFLHETRFFSIVHLYFDEQKITFLDHAKKEHPRFMTFNADHDPKAVPLADILFIELGDSSKDKLKLLLGLMTRHKPLICYIFSTDVENRLLLKFALHFGVTDVLPLKNEESVLFSIFTKNSNKLDEKLFIFQKIELEKKIEHFFPFLVFQGESLTYANAKAKKLYATNSLEEVHKRITADEEFCAALRAHEDIEVAVEIISNDETDVYVCMIKTFPQSDEKIVTLLHYDMPEQVSCCVPAVYNRFDFVDKLKDRLAQQSVTQKAISLICLNVANLDKLNKMFKNITIFEALKSLLNKLLELKDPLQDVVQWSPNMCIVMGENKSFEAACEQVRYIQHELTQSTLHEKITPILISSLFYVESHDLNEVLEYIEKINTKSLLPRDIEKIKYYEVEYFDEAVNEEDQIAYLLHNCINNKIPIKLLNIYKGLCINTSSMVIKMLDTTYTLSCENLQGYAMQMEGETVLQAPNFPKDIKATVSSVDIKRGIVVIKNLQFLHSSANSRQHTRVQTNIRTPVLIKYAHRSSAQGELIDISVNSIAMKVTKSFREEEMLQQSVRLNFSLPNDADENGYVIMDIPAKVTYIGTRDDYTKIVVMIENLPKPYDDYLLHYMYNRQKELIFEIKRATKAYN